METRKQRILETLNAWAEQRPGLDPRDYGDGTMDGWRNYRRESAHITKDLHDYRALAAAVSWRDSITADDLIKASERAFSGRLTINDISAHYDDGSTYWAYSIQYCTGQYWPTEYRKAACAVLANVLWHYFASDCPKDYIGTDKCRPWINKQVRNNLGQGIQRGWFN